MTPVERATALGVERRVCATCDALVADDDSHPDEWMCADRDCGIWWHVTDGDRCPECGSGGFE